MKIVSVGESNRSINIEKDKKPLAVGDIVKGRIVDNDNGLITIKTVGGQSITAFLLSEENLPEGSIISFIINQINEDKIYAEILKPKHIDDLYEKEIESVLYEIGAEQNDLNKEAVETLVKFWQPISKDRIDYINYILKTVEKIKHNSSEALLAMLLSDINILDSSVETLNKASLTMDLGNIINMDTLVKNTNPLNADIEKDISGFMKNLSDTFSLDKNTLESFEYLFHQSYKALSSIDKADLETVIYLLSKGIDITPQNLYIYNELINEEKGLTSFLIELINTLSNYDDSELKSYSKELSNTFIDIEDVKNLPLKEQLAKMATVLKQIDSAIEKRGIKDFKLLDNMHNLKSSINLIKSINHETNYYHIPLMINQYNSSVDIYIYKEGKRNKRVDISNVSILISMDLKNIGYIESLIQVSYKNINIMFRTENKNITDMVNQYSKELKDKLEEKGYCINIIAQEKTDNKFNLISFEDKLNNGVISRYSIDVRL